MHAIDIFEEPSLPCWVMRWPDEAPTEDLVAVFFTGYPEVLALRYLVVLAAVLTNHSVDWNEVRLARDIDTFGDIRVGHLVERRSRGRWRIELSGVTPRATVMTRVHVGIPGVNGDPTVSLILGARGHLAAECLFADVLQAPNQLSIRESKCTIDLLERWEHRTGWILCRGPERWSTI